MEAKIEAVKKTCANTERRRLCLDNSVKLCEYKIGRVIKVFKSDDGALRSATVEMAHKKLNRLVVNLAPVIYDGVSWIENRAGDIAATSNHKQKASDSKK